MNQPKNQTEDNEPLVQQLLAAGRRQEAVDLCRRVCQAPEAGPKDWLIYGCLCADMGDASTARGALEKAIEYDRDFVEARFALGKLFVAAGDYTPAIAEFEKAAGLQPDNPNIWLTLGITFGLARQADKAEECCRRSLAIQVSAPARFNLANALQAQGKLTEAEAEYEAALQIDGGWAAAWSMLAQARVGLRKFAEAEAAATRALALQPESGEAHFMLGTLLKERGDVSAARENFQQAARLLPNLPEAHLRLAEVRHHLGDHAGAAESCHRALNLDAGLAQAHFLLAECLIEQKMPGKAVESYREAVALNNNHLQAHYRLAFYLMNRGQRAEAAKHLAEIVRINPRDDQARHLLAAQQGETTAVAPAEYVSKLFDGIADTFDTKLVDTLNYHAPERLHELVNQLMAPAANSLDVIDLGCGTGLCAPLFREMARSLHGVDLAPRMVEKARERQLYDTLEVGDIVASLDARESAWDLVISTDVFVYLGDLGKVFRACAKALKPGGYFAFSVESGDDSDGFILRPSGRYAHASRYIRSLTEETGLYEIARRAVIVRREKGKDVPGFLFLLRKAVNAPKSTFQIEYQAKYVLPSSKKF